MHIVFVCGWIRTQHVIFLVRLTPVFVNSIGAFDLAGDGELPLDAIYPDGVREEGENLAFEIKRRRSSGEQCWRRALSASFLTRSKASMTA